MCSHSGQRVTDLYKNGTDRAISSGDLPSAIQQARAEIVTVSSQESMISPQDSICVDIMYRTELRFNGESNMAEIKLTDSIGYADYLHIIFGKNM